VQDSFLTNGKKKKRSLCQLVNELRSTPSIFLICLFIIIASRFLSSVTWRSGKFYRHKSSAHPHTNMAKAALNMMTRTSALDYRETSGIWMNAVDTGWINDENPLPTARRTADTGFQTPLDEVGVFFFFKHASL
jgi:NAD(P)-dependent dehydrogenase (short-subunit alcohol dehydrogenase family)